jgi:pimeloyl-[acyl-carrier protein] methyl ester esterase
MSLHVDSYEYRGVGGSGAPLLLIHGWAMHGGMWRGVAEKLAEHFHVLAVDLPGHGRSAAMGSADLDAVVNELSAQFSGPLNVCGWSLGGQVALRWALRYPQQVQRLILVASTPCFVRREDWSHAMSMELLLEFGAALRQHYALTLKRFLALQMRGGEQGRGLLAELRDTLFSCGEPDLDTLQAGLAILRNCDLRSALPLIMQPALIVAGERDSLAPMEASLYMAQQMPFAELVRIQGAAHAPFLSHPEIFVGQLTDFLRGKIT